MEERFASLEQMLGDLIRIVGNTNALVLELREELRGAKDRLGRVEEQGRSLQEELHGVKDEVRALKDDVQGLKNEVQVLKDDVQELKNEAQALNVKVDKLTVRTAELEKTFTERFDRLEDAVTFQRHRQADLEEEIYHIKKAILQS